MNFSKKIVISVILLFIVIFSFSNNVKADVVSLKQVLPINNGTKTLNEDRVDYYCDEKQLFMYRMVDNTNNIVYCLEPGKRADSGNTYEVNYYESISAIDSDLIDLPSYPTNVNVTYYSGAVYGNSQTSVMAVNRKMLLYNIISTIYFTDVESNPNMSNDDITIKQLLIWRFIDILKRENSINLTNDYTAYIDSQRIAQDAAVFTGNSGLKYKVDKYVENINTLFTSISIYSNTADYLCFNIYEPFTSANPYYGVRDMQVLIGPRKKQKKLEVEDRYYTSSGEFEGCERRGTISFEDKCTVSALSPENYTFKGSGIYQSSPSTSTILSSGAQTIEVTEDGNIVIFCYQENQPPPPEKSYIYITHRYTSSSGREQTKKTTMEITEFTDDDDDDETEPEYLIALDTTWKSFYVSNSMSLARRGNNLIRTGIQPGKKYYISINYKSKKININYITIMENGQSQKLNKEKTCTVGNVTLKTGDEINVNKNFEVTFDETNTYGTFTGSYLGYKRSWGASSNWTNRTINNQKRDPGVYTYNVYYEVRNVHKYVKLTTGSISGDLYDVNGNSYQKSYSSENTNFGSQLTISKNSTTNNFPNILYCNLTVGNYVKVSFNSNFKLAKSSTTYRSSKANDRKSAAIDSMSALSYKTYSSDTSNRIISALNKNSDGTTKTTFNHADTTVAYFYYDIEQPVKVYVRHMVKKLNGTDYVLDNSIANAKEIYYDAIQGSWSIVNNGYNQRKKYAKLTDVTDAVDTVNYSEMFTIDSADKLKLDKSRVLLKDGIQYVYKGHKKGVDSYGTALTSGTTVNVSGSAGNKIYVDFYYDETGYSDDDKSLKERANPKLKFQSQNSDGNYLGADTEQIAYVPAGEYIKPYFETASYVPYTLTYRLASIQPNDDGTITRTYEFNTCTIHQLSNATIVNKSNAGTSAVMLGSENEAVISTSNSYSLASRFTGIKQESSTTVREEYLNLGPNATSIPVGPPTGIGNFNNKDDVNSSKYNGLRLGDGTVTYGSRTVSTVENMDVNIYTPMKVAAPKIQSTGDMVNHSNIDNNQVIQKDTQFTLTPQYGDNAGLGYDSTKISTLDKYLKGYYVIFDFDIRKSDGTTVAAKTPIWVDKNGSITATPVGSEGQSSVKQLEEKITTIAVTINASEDFHKYTFNRYNALISDTENYSYIIAKSGETEKVTDKSLNKYESEFYDEAMKIRMLADSHYFVRKETSTYVLARLYDFKVTDCYDVDFKNVFRKSETNTVNDLTGVCYYSGIRKLLIHAGNNILYNRNENTILPVGPYKHTQYDYVKAPKLGYRISFDVKTYGYYDNKSTDSTRTVRITPSYYYISKDGNTFKENVKLYYKNSSGKYVTFNQSNYNISFKPNDGYRHLTNESTTNSTEYLSDKLVNINVGDSFTLDSKTMITTDNSNFIQAWYGEFKVPNSTIVIPEGGNINNPLKDGYLGVIFKIECIDKSSDNSKEVIVMYDQNDKTKDGMPNTSQWDYEGYMGVASGNNFSGSLQLEKGTWSIDNSRYNDIKGTVVLYDLDERAANDFE